MWLKLYIEVAEVCLRKTPGHNSSCVFNGRRHSHGLLVKVSYVAIFMMNEHLWTSLMWLYN